MQVDDIPKAWRAALASVQVLYPDAVIAGGCLRDREQGVKVKDIDIFVPCPDTDRDHGKLVEKRLKDDGWQDVQTLHDQTYSGERISRSIETKFPNCPPINIIVMPYDLDRFDFGICQIEFNGKTLRRTPAYNTDKAAQQFRLIPEVEDAEFLRTIERWCRLKEKYPTWKFNLGSRSLTMLSRRHTGGMISQSLAMTQARSRQFSHGHKISIKQMIDESTPLSKIMGMGPGDYVMPRYMAERVTRETTAQSMGMTSGGSVLVHVDAQAVTPAGRIIEDMLRERDHLTWKYTTAIGQPYSPRA